MAHCFIPIVVQATSQQIFLFEEYKSLFILNV